MNLKDIAKMLLGWFGFAVFAIAMSQICRKMGFSPAVGFLTVIPYLGWLWFLALLWYMAFAKWPRWIDDWDG